MLSHEVTQALKSKVSQAILDVEYDHGPIRDMDMKELASLCSSVVLSTIRDIQSRRDLDD